MNWYKDDGCTQRLVFPNRRINIVKRHPIIKKIKLRNLTQRLFGSEPAHPR
jgi:hypothetical protein